MSTLEQGQPVFSPVKLASYHRQALARKQLAGNTTLARKPDGWWLALSYEGIVLVATQQSAPVIGIDVGMANFIAASTGEQYGTFNGKLAERHKRDREKCRCKAKLRACLKKKGVKQLPSTRNKKLTRHVRQEINRAVNELYRDHPDAQFAYEHLNDARMKFKARWMNAYLNASNLAHIPAQLAWGAAKTGYSCQQGEERLQFPGMPSLSSCVSPEPAHAADVLLCSLGARQPCRSERGRKPGKPPA